MKTIKLGLVMALAATSLMACKKGGGFCFKGNGEVITEERLLTGFSEISLSTSADIHFTQADDYSVKVKASENLMSIIQTEVDHSTLKIKRKKNTCLRGNNPIDIYISCPDISRFSISGSGDIESKNLILTDQLDVKISGSGDIKLDSLSANQFNGTISGSGNMTVYGTDTLNDQHIKISGSGDINTINIPSKDAVVSIAGSGNCKIFATETLDVKISGSGDVIYKGSPAISSNIAGSGSLRHQ